MTTDTRARLDDGSRDVERVVADLAERLPEALQPLISSPEADAAVQDDNDAVALYDLLEHEIVPLFYERDPAGLPRRWISRIKVSMERLIPRFSAERMVAEYLSALYGAGEVRG